jgi:Zn-dependent protease
MLTGAAMQSPALPAEEAPPQWLSVVPGISSWPFFPGKRRAGGPGDEGTCIVGSLELDRYIVVPSVKIEAVRRILAAVQESRSAGEAHERLLRQGLRVDVEAFCEKLRGAGLLLDCDGSPVASDSSIDRLFLRLGSVRLERIGPAFRWLGRNLGGFSLVLLALSIWLVGRGLHGASLTSSFGMEWTSWTRYLVALLIMGLSFFLHEVSHGTVAARYGLSPRRFDIGLYLGFLPTFFLRVGGLYTLPPRQRIAVWAAGPLSNLSIALAAACVLSAWGEAAPGFLPHLILLNLMLGIFNLVPFLPTDGYFIASTLMRQTNIRKRSWNAFQDFRAGRGVSNLALVLYSIGTLLLIAFLLLARLLRILGSFGEHPLGAAVRLSLFLVLLGLFFSRWRRMKGPAESGAANG